MKHKLTVTIPSYKQPRQLDRALYALSLQTFKDFDVVIIDDNSGVDLTNTLSPYSDTLDIKLLKNEKNLGAMQNMLKTITLETDSLYIFSHHEDDYIKSNYLEAAVAILDSNSNISFVVSSAVWVKKDTVYTGAKIHNINPKLFNYNDFIVSSLKREPFIFGSVVYRKKDVGSVFKKETYHTLCDKVFLTDILIQNNSLCGYIQEPSIYVRDHSLDEEDTRSDGANINHLINFFNFYKKNLNKGNKEIGKLLTNGLLLSYSNLSQKTSLFDLYKKQKPYGLLSLRSVDIVGVYSLVSVIIGKKLSYKLTKVNFLKRIITI